MSDFIKFDGQNIQIEFEASGEKEFDGGLLLPPVEISSTVEMADEEVDILEAEVIGENE